MVKAKWNTIDSEWLRQRYEDDEMSVEEIAHEIGMAYPTVFRAVKAFGIKTRKAGLLRPSKRRADLVPQLRDKAWLEREYIERGRSAEDIARELGVTLYTVRTRLKNLVRKQPKRQPGISIKRRGGYILTWQPDHPAAVNGYVSEHRLVAERELGRHLARAEQVHHLNLKRDDNRPENLLVFATYGAHMDFHHTPPAWVPRCECCGHALPERLAGRPADVPLIFDLSTVQVTVT